MGKARAKDRAKDKPPEAEAPPPPSEREPEAPPRAGTPAPTPAAAAAPAPFQSTSLGFAALALAAAFILVFVIVGVQRLRYPFALEWMEGGMLGEMRWLLEGHNLYVRPSVDYVPFIYNPLYFWVCGAVAKVLGASFFTMRLVSYLSALGTMGLLYKLVSIETEEKVMGIVAAGLYASTFKVTQQFMDIARVDSLFVLLAMASLWVLRTRPTAKGRALAAVLLVLCFLAKQSGLFVAAPIVVFVLWDGVRGAKTTAERLRGVPFAAIVGGGILGSALLLDATSDGWYRYFAFELPSGHRLVPWMWWEFWTADLMAPLGCACVGALFVLFGPSGMPRRVRELWAAALAGLVLCAWSGRLHDGGWTNVVMPAYAILSALFAIALHGGLTFARAAAPDTRRSVQAFVALLGLVQLAVSIYDPRHVVPTRRDEAAGWDVVAALRGAQGDTFAPSDNYLSEMAGKHGTLHQMAVDDILRGGESEVRTKLIEDLRAAFHDHRWAMVVTDNDFFAAEVLANYQRGPISVKDADTFFPVTGVHIRPGWIYLPK